MAVIKLLTGTTEDYKAVETKLILDEREIAVEVVSDEAGRKYYNIRQGDGKSKFFDLPIIVDNKRYSELNTGLSKYYDEIMAFKTNMETATTAATNAAQAATEAATAASGAAGQVESLTKGLNSMTDDLDGKEYVMGIEGGVVYLEEQTS